MKTFTLLATLLVVLVGCQPKSSEEITPAIAGIYSTYTLNNMEGEVLQFPTHSTDGKVLITSEVEITKLDEYQISILRKGTAWGTPYSDPLGLFDIRRDGSEYIVYKDGLYVGSITTSKLYLNFAGKSKNTMIASIRATR